MRVYDKPLKHADGSHTVVSSDVTVAYRSVTEFRRTGAQTTSHHMTPAEARAKAWMLIAAATAAEKAELTVVAETETAPQREGQA